MWLVRSAAAAALTNANRSGNTGKWARAWDQHLTDFAIVLGVVFADGVAEGTVFVRQGGAGAFDFAPRGRGVWVLSCQVEDNVHPTAGRERDSIYEPYS